LKRALALLAVAAVMPLAACGDDDDDDGGGGGGSDSAETDTAATVKLTADAKGAIDVSGEGKPGVATITLTNQGKKPASAQLIRVEGEHSEQEVLKAYEGAGNGEVIPEWLRAEGGVGEVPPGASASVTQEMVAGTYYAFNDAGEKPVYDAFELTGEESGGELPETTGTVTATDEGDKNYSFEAEGLTAGKNTVLFQNDGQQPHHLIAFPLAPGKTTDDVVQFLKTEKGPPPVNFEEGAGTSVIDGEGKSMAVDLELKKGNYALLCFIADREGGKEHALKGMVSETTVE
jgi:hypothetical protein